MKILLKIIFLCCVSFLSWEDVNSQPHEGEIIETSSISIYKIGSKRTITLLNKASGLTANFGAPLRIEKGPTEMYPETISTTYYYKGAEFWFTGGSMEGAQLTDKSFYVKYKGKMIKVGDHISTLRTVFPESYGSRMDGGIYVGFKHLGQEVDANIVFNYNSSNVIYRIII